MEKNIFDCDVGYFLDTDHFVRICIQENRKQIIYIYIFIDIDIDI